MDAIREEIRQLLCETLQKSNDTRPFSDEESLIVGGRLQSLDVLEIVLFLEQRFALDFSDGFDRSQLDSVDEILGLIQNAKV